MTTEFSHPLPTVLPAARSPRPAPQLQSTNSAIRRAACDAVANMVTNEAASVQTLLREGVMQRLMPALCDGTVCLSPRFSLVRVTFGPRNVGIPVIGMV
jgi:hypothetical protein